MASSCNKYYIWYDCEAQPVQSEVDQSQEALVECFSEYLDKALNEATSVHVESILLVISSFASAIRNRPTREEKTVGLSQLLTHRCLHTYLSTVMTAEDLAQSQ